MKAAKHRGTDGRTWTCPGVAGHGPGHAVAAPKATVTMNSPGPSNPVYQDKWAGNVVVDSARYAQMDWKVPAGYPVGSTCGSMVSFWPGLGSGSSDQLVQAGSEDHYDCASYGGGN